MEIKHLGDRKQFAKREVLGHLAGVLTDLVVDLIPTEHWTASQISQFICDLDLHSISASVRHKRLYSGGSGYFLPLQYHPGDIFLDPHNGLDLRKTKHLQGYRVPLGVPPTLMNRKGGVCPDRILIVYQECQRTDSNQNGLARPDNPLYFANRFSGLKFATFYASHMFLLFFGSRDSARFEHIYSALGTLTMPRSFLQRHEFL